MIEEVSQVHHHLGIVCDFFFPIQGSECQLELFGEFRLPTFFHDRGFVVDVEIIPDGILTVIKDSSDITRQFHFPSCRFQVNEVLKNVETTHPMLICYIIALMITNARTNHKSSHKP